MSVETVDRDIQLAVLKPFYAKIIQIIVNVADFGRFFYPIDQLGTLRPKSIISLR